MLAEHLSRADLVGVLAIIHGSVASRGDADFRSLVRRLEDLVGARAGVTAITSTWGGMTGTRQGLGYATGVRDPREAAASFFCFQGLARSRRTEEILALVVPHLHVALRGVARAAPDSTPLTGRETEILRWVAQGKTTWAISEILSISERTVKFHVANAVRKLDATTRAHAVAVALERKLIQVD
jgi:DNA-binding CsgD family transcriptional regulator